MGTIAPALPISDRHIYAIYDYSNSLVSDAVWELKYHGKSETMRALVHTAVPHILKLIPAGRNTVIVPIPQHKKKTRARGYNQSALLAKWLAGELPKAVVKEILKKDIFTLPQARIKHRTERLRNLEHSMAATRTVDPDSLYLLIDDVTTTGATFIEARRALYDAGAKNVVGIAIAHGYARKK